jgi:putative Mn2+ efflux pump MntP
MSILECFILAFALALDALLVSFSYGLVLKDKKVFYSMLLAVFFGFFQFLMPVLGWKLTSYIYTYLEIYAKWIVFAVFLGLGLKFLQETRNEEKSSKVEYISLFCVLTLAIATSIDAFGAGVSIRFLNTGILKPSLIIGLTTFALSLGGFWTANFCQKLKSKIIEYVGAFLLIYLAIKAII